ncbi:UNVERIFIED_CONTAM: hypothetical protein K2H54_069246 [Gekko kuhli]
MAAFPGTEEPWVLGAGARIQTDGSLARRQGVRGSLQTEISVQPEDRAPAAAATKEPTPAPTSELVARAKGGPKPPPLTRTVLFGFSS